MAEFEELQQLWQRQPRRATPLNDAAELTNAFRRYGRRHDLIYLGKTVVIAFQLILLLSLLRHPLAIFGACLADFSAILFLVSDWRTQRAIARLNFAAPSLEFLRSAVARLEEQRNPFRSRHLFIALGGFWVGLGLMLADVWRQMPLPVLALAIITAAPFLGYAQAVRIRRKRFEKRCRPLIERLESVLQTMEADRV